MAEAEDLLEQARQKLVQIARAMMRFMDDRSRNESQFFRGMVERAAPGLQGMIDRGYNDAQISATLGSQLRSGWEGNLTQAFELVRPETGVFQDRAVQQANREYFAMVPQLIERADEVASDLRAVDAPEAAADFERQVQEATARIGAAAPPGRPTSPTRAPGGPATPPLPTPPLPAQAPGVGQVPGAGPTPPQTRAGQAGQASAQPVAGQAPGAGATTGQAQGTTKRVEAREAGPVALDTRLMNAAGSISITTGPPGSRAHISFSTTATDGPAADAVNNADLRGEPGGRMVANATVNGASARVTVQQNNGTFTQTVTQSGSSGIAIVGNVGEMTIDGNNIRMGNVSGSNNVIAIGSNAVASSHSTNGRITNSTVAIGGTTPPIHVEAVVPEGSTVVARSDSAHITTDGNLTSVDAHSVSGDISTGRAGSIKATSVSGNVKVHVDRPCDVRAGSTSGNVEVTASSPDVAGQSRLNTAAEPGKLRMPEGANSPTPQPGRAGDGARENPTRGNQTRQTGQGLGGA